MGVEITVLASSPDDCAIATVDQMMFGAASDEVALLALSRVTDVVTFDHELVDLDMLSRLEERGVMLRPSAAALRYSVDKAFQREEFSRAGFPLPAYAIVRHPGEEAVLEGWSQRYGAAPVLKAARGGYDGRGVNFTRNDAEARQRALELLVAGQVVVVEERVTLISEVSQVLVRSARGQIETYPLVTTVQSGGMCAEVRFPTELAPEIESVAAEIGRDIAEFIELVGVMAVEYFVSSRGLLINELALRPHNSGHWSIEGATTSQFANHLLAVSGQEVRAPSPTNPAAVMVNVVGANAPGSLDAARQVGGVHVHDYGKAWRPGRKLGHVTAVGDDIDALHVRAWRSARAYGTNTQEA